jgi:hypothetical protein
MSVSSSLGRIGLICDAGHSVFSVVAEDLEDRGFRVEFFEPGQRVAPGTIDGLDLLANKKVDPESFRALRYAERHDVPTWNGYTTATLGARLVGLTALEAVGFEVPRTTREKPAGEYVAKSLFDWHDADGPELNGEGDVYQELLPAKPIDDKYYAVDDGDRIHVRLVLTESKLSGSKEYLGRGDPVPSVAANLRRLLERTGSQAIGVDVVRSHGEYYAVDVNPAMSFRNAGLETELADSMAAGVRAAGTRHPARTLERWSR